ncbi:helix-turn-helix domain-containing protein [Halalkalibacterium ligniniphilum]|uniref:helix-turn-helix domain-containing protein n=1 Tax=Halalkalibacterium ligniniphilum TaxID=1134413 RepID=UPI00034CDF84|nr:helix-turn-helix transcriptional regulator [Halalkalibacterium ligniniphilum]
MLRSKIGYWIDERGLQTKFIAKKLEVSETQVSKWKGGNAHPRVDKLFKLAKLLGVKVDELYEEIDSSGTSKNEDF